MVTTCRFIANITYLTDPLSKAHEKPTPRANVAAAMHTGSGFVVQGSVAGTAGGTISNTRDTIS